MANTTPPPGSPYIVPPGVTNAEINIANEPPSSPVPPNVGFDDWTAADTDNFALGPIAKKALRSRCLAELNDVLRFLCLDFGCQHERGEISLSSGALDSTCAVGRCTTCPICNRTYHKDFIPVYRIGVVSYLEWLIATSKLPFAVDLKIQVSSLLMCSEYWKEIIFDKSSSSVS
jgi:hypothetical protein